MVGALTVALVSAILGEVVLIAMGKIAPGVMDHSITASLTALAALLARTDKEDHT